MNSKDFKGKNIETHEYVLPKSWRLISTLNTYDKASLYQMSYAFMRRFAFINVTVPSSSFIDQNWDKYLKCWGVTTENLQQFTNQIKEFWKGINSTIRPLGPAVIKDMLEFLLHYERRNEAEVKEVMAVLISAFVLPQFEGLETEELNTLKELLNNFCEVEKIERLFKEMFE